MEAFPDAKVVLTVRDNAEGWHKSVKESIYQTIAMNAGKQILIFYKFSALFLCKTIHLTNPVCA
jgi:hypothetical protein